MDLFLTLSTKTSSFMVPTVTYSKKHQASELIHFAIMFTVPPLPPTNLQVSDIGNRTATLTWQAPVVTFLNSLTAVSSFQVMATQEQFANVSDIYVNVGAGVTTYMFPQTLEEYTVYTCTVKARNAFGLGNATQPVTLRTLQAGMPCISPSGILVA